MQKKKTEIFCDSSLRIGLELVSAKKTCINLTLVLSLGKCPALHSLEWIEVVETRPEFEDVHLCLIVFITFNLSCGFLPVVKKIFFSFLLSGCMWLPSCCMWVRTWVRIWFAQPRFGTQVEVQDPVPNLGF